MMDINDDPDPFFGLSGFNALKPGGYPPSGMWDRSSPLETCRIATYMTEDGAYVVLLLFVYPCLSSHNLSTNRI